MKIYTYESVSKSFRTESIMKYTLTFGITRCCPLQRVMEAKLTRLTQKISITTAPSGRELYHLQFSLQAASPETFCYTLVHRERVLKFSVREEVAVGWVTGSALNSQSKRVHSGGTARWGYETVFTLITTLTTTNKDKMIIKLCVYRITSCSLLKSFSCLVLSCKLEEEMYCLDVCMQKLSCFVRFTFNIKASCSD
jgi:hypothetical protein